MPAEVTPRDDRAWPPGSRAVSVVLGGPRPPAERPGPPQPLTVPAPHPAQEPTVQTGSRRGFAASVIKRLALLAAFSVFLSLAG